MCADIVKEGVQAFITINSEIVNSFPIFKPLAWTRLEPQSLSGDPDQALAARIHDPLWLLGRQWQFGEFQGEDAGTPVAVQLAATARRMTAFAPEDGRARSISESDVIEPEVEAEPFAGATLREKAEAGSLLAAMLADSGAKVRAKLAAECPLDVPADGGPSAPVPAMWRLLSRSGIDGSKAAAQIEDGSHLSSWSNGLDATAKIAVSDWLAWFRANVEPLTANGDCWQQARLEYGFLVRTGAGANQRPLRATAHDGGPVDWYSFDSDQAQISIDSETAVDVAETLAATVHATRLRYAGMPATRFWRFEDGQVNFGMVEVQPHDINRIAFLDFATVHADDWLVAPLDVPRGALIEMDRVTYRTTFNEAFDVGQGNTGPEDFELFTLNNGSATPLRALLVPPGGRYAVEGTPIEEVVFARDETANMVWAIEKRVEGPTGDPRERSLEPPLDDSFQTIADADLTYRLERSVPSWWIPMVPVPKKGNRGGFHLRKGSFNEEDASRGKILRPTPLDMYEEEVPREGIIVRRVPSLMRDNQGHLRRWIARRTSVARGEANSALSWDGAVRG
jgi:hypothetical protein